MDERLKPTLEEATLTDAEFLRHMGHHKPQPCKGGCVTHVDAKDGYCRRCKVEVRITQAQSVALTTAVMWMQRKCAPPLRVWVAGTILAFDKRDGARVVTELDSWIRPDHTAIAELVSEAIKLRHPEGQHGND